MADGTVVEIALAEIRLLRGRDGARSFPTAESRASSSADQVLFHGARPSRLVVGSDHSATWPIARADVAPRQFDIVWDGAALWLQDAFRLGRTFVNGKTLNEWQPIQRHALVCFGGVQMFMASRMPPTGQCAPDFDALDRARLTDAHQSARFRLMDTSPITLPPELLRALNERGAR